VEGFCTDVRKHGDGTRVAYRFSGGKEAIGRYNDFIIPLYSSSLARQLQRRRSRSYTGRVTCSGVPGKSLLELLDAVRWNIKRPGLLP
jgi:hypothetical protein